MKASMVCGVLALMTLSGGREARADEWNERSEGRQRVTNGMVLTFTGALAILASPLILAAGVNACFNLGGFGPDDTILALQLPNPLPRGEGA